MATMAGHDSFLTHLIAVLSLYELGPSSVPAPGYDGPSDWQTESILRSLTAVARRMYAAEDALAAIQASESERCGPEESKKRRRGVGVGDDTPLPPVGSSSSSTSRTRSDPDRVEANSASFVRTPSSSTEGIRGTLVDSHGHDIHMLDTVVDTEGEGESATTPQAGRPRGRQTRRTPSPTAISLGDAAHPLESPDGVQVKWSADAAPTAACAHCGASPHNGPDGPDVLQFSEPVITPVGPLALNTFESSVSAVEELKLLRAQVQDVARVCYAVARGDLSQRVTVPMHGVVMVQIMDVINAMVSQLTAFASEVARVSREVGAEGKLGGQALVPHAEGTWKDLTTGVNQLAARLTGHVRSVAWVARAVAVGDLSRRIEMDARGEILECNRTVNAVVDRLRVVAAELTRLALEVGSRGELGRRAHVPDADGVWLEMARNVNEMCAGWADQARAVARVAQAVAGGDLTDRLALDVRGENLAMKDAVNGMVESLSVFAEEVARAAREAGVEGCLLGGGRAGVTGVGAGGVWKDLADSVNALSADSAVRPRTGTAATVRP